MSIDDKCIGCGNTQVEDNWVRLDSDDCDYIVKNCSGDEVIRAGIYDSILEKVSGYMPEAYLCPKCSRRFEEEYKKALAVMKKDVLGWMDISK